MPIELFRQGDCLRLMFCDLHNEHGEAVQSNQFLLVNGDTGAIIDPGGNLAYHPLYLGMVEHFAPTRLSAILASHADSTCSTVAATITSRPGHSMLNVVFRTGTPAGNPAHAAPALTHATCAANALNAAITAIAATAAARYNC